MLMVILLSSSTCRQLAAAADVSSSSSNSTCNAALMLTHAYGGFAVFKHPQTVFSNNSSRSTTWLEHVCKPQ
jgi:hypothetical protein